MEYHAKLDQDRIFQTMWSILEKVDGQQLPLSRIHMHAINMHLVCFDLSIWRSGRGSLAASIATSLQMAGGYSKTNFSTIIDHLDSLRFNMPSGLDIKTKYGHVLKTPEELVKVPITNFMYGRLE